MSDEHDEESVANPEPPETESPDDERPGATPETQRDGSSDVAQQDSSSNAASTARIEAYTTGRLSLSPDVQLLWGIRATVVTLLIGLVVGAVLFNVGVHPAFAVLVGAALVVAGVVWVLLRYRVWVYQIREDTIYLERGVFTHVRTLVPYVRIQHVDTSRGPLERTLGLSSLVVYTAGSRGADVSIPGLTPEQARDLQQRVKELAIEAEGDDAL